MKIQRIKQKIKELLKRNNKKNLYCQKTNKKKISYYTVKEINEKEEYFLSSYLTDKDLNNFIYLNDKIKIIFKVNIQNEEETLSKWEYYISVLEKHNKKYNIELHINNRELLNKSKILKQINNINLTIYNCFTEYTIEEYLENENKLNELIKSIKESDLSPYEKYLAAYNIVKQYKEYKECENNPSLSRSLKYILDKENEYMVCVGYSDLLTTLLDKLDIPSFAIHVEVDEIDRKEEQNKNLPSELSGHQRNIIKLDDDKYNIHGFYTADPTWDNNQQYDIYINSLLTFDKKKESNILEALNTIDLLLDFHNFEDFNLKINTFLQKEINSSKDDTYNKKIISGFNYIYYRIMQLLYKLDNQKYIELRDKYENRIINMTILYNKQKISSKTIEEIYSDFLTEYANYIIPLSNNKVSDTMLYEAATNVKRVIDKYDYYKIQEWLEETKEINKLLEECKFPYVYNPNEKRNNYLKSKTKNLTKEK